MTRTPDVDDDTLFREYATSRDRRVRNEIVERHLGLAVHIAKRYSSSHADEELRQVAMLGLVKAVDRFDPDHGAAFSSFAGTTIEGELKRHFRDRTWTLRVPRSAKELHLSVRRATEELSQRLGHSPSVDQIAAHLDVDRDDVLRGMAATAAYSVGTLDSVGADDDSGDDRYQRLADDGNDYDSSDDRHMVTQLIRRLPEREQEIVVLRFFDELSQAEIAERVGVSQMHVSRLLRRSFEQMREWSTDQLDEV
ncbi:MAG: SigB/SigF/SigG family RNA polymerase sigma factor [Ilumatobacteraceae bacterium]